MIATPTLAPAGPGRDRVDGEGAAGRSRSTGAAAASSGAGAAFLALVVAALQGHFQFGQVLPLTGDGPAGMEGGDPGAAAMPGAPTAAANLAAALLGAGGDATGRSHVVPLPPSLLPARAALPFAGEANVAADAALPGALAGKIPIDLAAAVAAARVGGTGTDIPDPAWMEASAGLQPLVMPAAGLAASDRPAALHPAPGLAATGPAPAPVSGAGPAAGAATDAMGQAHTSGVTAAPPLRPAARAGQAITAGLAVRTIGPPGASDSQVLPGGAAAAAGALDADGVSDTVAAAEVDPADAGEDMALPGDRRAAAESRSALPRPVEGKGAENAVLHAERPGSVATVTTPLFGTDMERLLRLRTFSPSRLMESVSAAVRSARPGRYVVSGTLQPPRLGRVQVNIELSHGTVRVNCTVASQGALQALGGQEDILRNLLAESGIVLAGFGVDLGGSNGGREPGGRDGGDADTGVTPVPGPAPPRTRAGRVQRLQTLDYLA